MDYDSDCVSYCLYCQLKIPSDIHYCSTLCQWRDLCLPNVPEIMTSQIVYAGGYMEKSNVSFNDSDDLNDSNSCLASSVSSNEKQELKSIEDCLYCSDDCQKKDCMENNVEITKSLLNVKFARTIGQSTSFSGRSKNRFIGLSHTRSMALSKLYSD
ncbi:hypothetical protein BC833DRAFT_562065 [Globomyces pollinis-pini]|nr:hypothetical protein BC833DRAFT_562065 [Globomyces pollinis-pini]